MATDGTESATAMVWVAKDADAIMAGSDTSALKVAAHRQWDYEPKLLALA